MKVGIITSGSDMLTLWKFLHKYNNEYIIFLDDLFWPYGDKPVETIQSRILIGIQYARKQKCQYIILPPTRELFFLDEKYIAPLFQKYLFEYCFFNSLVGKIGILGDWSDLCIAQNLLSTIAKKYTLQEKQQKTKAFHFPFARWAKEVQMRKYFLTTLSYSNPLVHTIIKNDIRYFKDADVDTLIPLNYGYFHYQKIIRKICNYKRYRFHGLDKLELCFTKVIDNSKEDINYKTDTYSVHIGYTGQKELLQRQKKVIRLLQRGKQISITREKI